MWLLPPPETYVKSDPFLGQVSILTTHVVNSCLQIMYTGLLTVSCAKSSAGGIGQRHGYLVPSFSICPHLHLHLALKVWFCSDFVKAAPSYSTDLLPVSTQHPVCWLESLLLLSPSTANTANREHAFLHKQVFSLSVRSTAHDMLGPRELTLKSRQTNR